MKHTPTPWIISTNGKHIANLSQNEIATFLSAENAYYAIEACNNYEKLQSENAKLQESNNAMAEWLINVYNKLIKNVADYKELKNNNKDFKAAQPLIEFTEQQAIKIKEVLTAAGHKV